LIGVRSALQRLLSLSPLAWLMLIFVAPLVTIAMYSVAHPGYGSVVLGFTTENFRQALSGFYLTIFLRTLEFAALGTGLCLIVALPFAYFLALKVTRYRVFLMALILVPFWTSFLIRTLSWRTLLAQEGVIARTLNFLHLHGGPLGVLDTGTAVKIGIVYGYLPFMTLPLFVAFERISPEVREASKDLGAGRIATFLRVTLPLARPGLVAGVLLTLVPMTGEYAIPSLLGGAKGMLFSGAIQGEFSIAQNYAQGSAMAMLLLATLGVAVFVFVRLTKGFSGVAG
jgi:spermidine/putrescine transport system permease protein